MSVRVTMPDGVWWGCWILSLSLISPWWRSVGVWSLRALRNQGPHCTGGAREWRNLASRTVLLGSLALALAGASPRWALVPPVLGVAAFLALRRWRSFQAAQALEVSTLACFHALGGLVRSGLDLSAALFHLASDRAPAAPFARVLRGSLDGFGRGQTLEACLERCAKRVSGTLLRASLGALAMAYRQGIAVGPVLDRVVPALEADWDMRQRLGDARRSALVQGAIASLLPWGVVAAFWMTQPELASRLWSTSTGRALVVWAVGMNLGGVRLLWNVANFH